MVYNKFVTLKKMCAAQKKIDAHVKNIKLDKMRTF